MSTMNIPVLNAELRSVKQQLAQEIAPDLWDEVDASLDALIASGVDRNALRAGQTAPEFCLPAVSGELVRLNDWISVGPVVVTFYRGGWCPYCNVQLRAYQRLLPELRKRHACILAISPELPEMAREIADSERLDFPLLVDHGNRVAHSYGIAFQLDAFTRSLYVRLGINLPHRNGDDSYSLPLSATFVIAPDGVVRLAWTDSDYTRRLEPAAILATLDGR